MSFPIIGIWVDMIIIGLLLSIITKIIQHLTVNPEKYAHMKLKTKEIQKEVKEHSKKQDFSKVKEKNKESFKLVGKQFSMSKNSMFVMMFIAIPLLYFINKYYKEYTYDFLLFNAGGIGAYIIFTIGFSLILNSLYDKWVIKRYKSTYTGNI